MEKKNNTTRKLQNDAWQRSSFITLPKRDIELLGWKKGDVILVDTDVVKKEVRLERCEGGTVRRVRKKA